VVSLNPTGDGWRARIGIVFPSTNTSIEPWFSRIAPEGVSMHFARMPMGAEITPASLDELEKHELAACQLVADSEPDVIMYACTSSMLVRGRDAESSFGTALSQKVGIPVCTTSDATVKASRALGMSKISIGSPYTEDIGAYERRYFEEAGFDVVNSIGLGIRTGRDISFRPAGDAYRLGRSAYRPEADGLVMTCVGFRAQECVAELERDLGVPVVTSAQATLWAALRLAGVQVGIPSLGRLFDQSVVFEC
jgi:maleate isomerase